MNVSAQIDPRDLRQLNSAIHRMAREMPGDAAKIVTDVGKITIGKAMSKTPAAAKKTKKIWKDKDDLTVITLSPSKAKSTPGRLYAKACWIPAYRKLGGGAKVRPAKEGSYDDKRRGLKPIFAARNECPYIEALDSGGTLEPIPTKPRPHTLKPKNIAARGMAEAEKALNKKIEKYAQKQFEKWLKYR